MILLVSKVQHKNFEEGEFIVEKKRTYNEVISLIETFPWNIEREKILIRLTNPSITIQRQDGSFLKFAVFYNHKFVLHYFNEKKELYTKSFSDTRNSFPFIKSYFDSGEFSISEFKKENTWLQQNLKHFKSQDFRYFLNKKSIKKYLLSTSAINLSLSIFLICLILIKGISYLPFLAFIFLFLIAFFCGGGINLLVTLNYYLYVKNKLLIMSKGNNLFYYGDKYKLVEYDKQNIVLYTTYQILNSRNPLSGFAVVKVEFKDATSIQIPNILLDEYALQDKLFEYPHKSRNKIRFLKWN